MAAIKNVKKFDFLLTSVNFSAHFSLKQTPPNSHKCLIYGYSD